MASYGAYYLLDTDILLDLLKKQTSRLFEENFINKHVNCCVSTLTWFEVIREVNQVVEDDKQVFLDFLIEVIAPNVKLISFDEHAAWIAADIANYNNLNNITYNTRDLEQLAISISNNLLLITNRIERYKIIKATYTLNTEDWGGK